MLYDILLEGDGNNCCKIIIMVATANNKGVSNDRQFSHERPKRPDKNLQSLICSTQLTKEELKHFYRAFKQVRD